MGIKALNEQTFKSTITHPHVGDKPIASANPVVCVGVCFHESASCLAAFAIPEAQFPKACDL